MRVLLLTGAGRGFCAGQDLGDRAVAPGDAPVDLGASIERNYKPLVLALRALPMPVVCAVNGVAAGAGANIALACDIVIAAKSASFIQAFCKIGLVPDSGGTYFLPRLVGTRARDGPRACSATSCPRSRRRRGGSSGSASTTREFAAAVDALLAQLAQAPTRGSRRDQARRCTRRRTTRSRRSSTSSATCSASSATATTTAKASRRSSRSGRRSSPAARLAMADALPREDATVAVIGAGAMGAGIAQIAAQAGHRVQLYDARLGAGDEAKRGIAEALDNAGGEGQAWRGPTPMPRSREDRHRSSRARRSASRKLVIEAIVEDLDGEARAVRASSRIVVAAECDPRVEHVVALDHGARAPD